ncbi:MAG: hypothetical protein J6I42_09365, partial [Clostridia bacterium]|nr:hypothetical protein [Clostridia bacterium]
MQLMTEYSKGKSLEEITDLLQKLYHGGNGIVTDSGRYSAWYAEDGIHISSGDSTQYMASAQIVSWEDAAKRIGELLDSGQFAANVETAEARTWELKTAAEHLWYLHHDFADNVRDEYFDAAMWRGGFPDSTERIADMLRDDAIREIIIAETARFAEAYRKDSSVMRFHFYKPDNILKELTEIRLPRREYTSEMGELPEVQQFITEDEINAALNRGGSVEGGKIRIYEFFTADHTLQEQADFLRNEYGTGGYSHAVSGMTHSGADYSSKGLVLKKANCPEVQLSWSKVAGRYTDLIKKDRYFTPEEQQQYELLHAQNIARNASYEEYQRIKAEHPENIVLYQAGDFFELYGEDARTATDILEISLTTRRLNTVGAVPMCGIPVHTLEANIKKLREKYAVTIASVKEVYSLRNSEPEPTLEPDEPPVKTEITEDDIREAFRNLDFERKIQVQEYMQEHGRERKTAAWLAEIFGGDVSAPHYVTVTGVDGSVELSWSKIQRIIGGMVNDGTYLTFTESEELERRNRRAAIENLSDEQQLIVKAMETAGFLYAYAASGIEFHAENDGYPLTFDSWEQAYVWIDSAELAGEPGLREKVQEVLHWDDSPEEPAYTIETTAVYSGEEHNLPYDVVFQTIKTDPPAPLVPDAQNFRITDDNLGVGGSKAKYQANINAIRLLKTLEEDGMQALPEQQEVLSRYVGWGGLADAFDESKDNWKNEYAELKSLLTPEEYAAARASTLNAHYTSPTVIKAMYEAIENMGFRTGNVLEPSMGVGNFFGLLPDNLSESRLYGVELDSITGRIAKQLYPKADITVAGFETTDRRDFFDLAIGNVPFGNYKVDDRDYNKLGFNIHNYFFAKALDQIRPGGVIAFVTSHYTMDSKDTSVRKYLAKRAELLGAIRLPNNAFKANAGTEVT